jgi:peptide/nickel transport system substrate-binding protein
MNRMEIDNLVAQLQSGDLSRRGFMRRATALGVSAAAAGMMASNVLAQESTPIQGTPIASPAASPVASPGASPTGGTGQVISSISIEEAKAEIEAAFPFEEPQNQGGQFIQTETTDISTLNTVLTGDVYSAWIAGFIYDGLIGTSPVNGREIPTGLAKSWEIAADGITYTLKLHENVKWHDGEPFTADDVIFTYDMALAEDSQSVRKSTIEDVLASYEKVDDYTVRFVAIEPVAVFLSDALGQFGIMPKHIWEGIPAAEWPADPGSTGQDPSRVIGTGPFKFVEWVLGDHVTLEKNADYWDQDEVPVIDTYTYQVLADPASAIAALQTGATDMTDIPFTQATPLRESNPELQILNYDTTSFNYYYTNQAEDKGLPFTDVKVRQALQYALDRDLIAETVYNGFAIRADGTQPVLSIAYAPDRINTIYTYDPEKAAALLDEAGWTMGGDGIREKDGQRLSFETLYSEGVATYEQQIPYMQQAWREAGIEMLPSAIPFPTLLEQTDAGNYQMAVLGFSWDIDGTQDIMFACDATPPAGFNNMRYCNPEYDELIEASKRELDLEKRIDILIEMSNIVNDDAAVGITVFRQDIYGASPRVHNFFPNGYSEVWWLSRAWLDQA